MKLLFCVLFSFITTISTSPINLLDSNDSSIESSQDHHVQPFEDLHTAGTTFYGNSKTAGDVEKFDVNDDEDGYYKAKSNKGNKGYKHFDSFHKKGGDKYGYEQHESLQMKKAGKDDNGVKYKVSGSIKHYAPMKKIPANDHKSAGTDYSYSHYESEGDSGEHQGEGGDGEHYSEGEDEHYSDGEGEHYSEGDGEHYSESDDGEHYSEGDDGEHYSEGDGEHYSEGGDGEHYSEGDSEHYSEGGLGNHGSDFEGNSAGYRNSYQAEPASDAYRGNRPQTGGKATSYYIRHY